MAGCRQAENTLSLRAQMAASHRQGRRVMGARFLRVSLPSLPGAGHMTVRSPGYAFGTERAD